MHSGMQGAAFKNEISFNHKSLKRNIMGCDINDPGVVNVAIQ